MGKGEGGSLAILLLDKEASESPKVFSEFGMSDKSQKGK
jgi:hypothetical protein